VATAKIPIVSIARGSASPNQTIHVAMDEKQIGRDIAEWTARKLGGKGKVALLMGPSGAPTFRNLGDGYNEVMAKYPGIEIVCRADGPLTRERGVKQAEDVLAANPDLAAIYTANDDVALGAMQAVNTVNRKGKTLVTGMNAVPPALRAVKEDNLAMTVDLNPAEWGRLGVDVLAAFLKGDKVEPPLLIKHVIIDSGNIDAKLPKTRGFLPLPACEERSAAEGGRVRGTPGGLSISRVPLTPTLSTEVGYIRLRPPTSNRTRVNPSSVAR